MNHILLFIISGTAVGLLFNHLHIPGGAMLGGMIGALGVKLLGHYVDTMPDSIMMYLQLAMGICVGTMCTPEIFIKIKAELPIMAGSTVILLITGLIAAVIVHHLTDMDAISSVLSTSPGGINIAIGMVEGSEYLPEVMMFQTVRLYTLIFFLPLCCWILKLFLQK